MRTIRVIRYLCGIFIFSALCGALGDEHYAEAPEGELSTPALVGDGNMWVTMHLNHNLTEEYYVGLGLQGRLGDNFAQLRRVRVRPLAGIRYKQWNLMMGYDLISNFNPNASEHRFMQQIIYKQPIGLNYTLALRGRLEERLIQGVSGHMVRARTMAQLTYQVPNSPLYLTGWLEGFFNLNMRPEWPQNTYGQMRLYSAVGKQINDRLIVEAGYQLRHTPFRRPRPHQMNHIVFVQLFVEI